MQLRDWCLWTRLPSFVINLVLQTFLNVSDEMTNVVVFAVLACVSMLIATRCHWVGDEWMCCDYVCVGVCVWLNCPVKINCHFISLRWIKHRFFSVCFSAGNVFVVSLAFADLVVAFYPYPLVLYALFHDGWALGNTQCTVRPRQYQCFSLVLIQFHRRVTLFQTTYDLVKVIFMSIFIKEMWLCCC